MKILDELYIDNIIRKKVTTITATTTLLIDNSLVYINNAAVNITLTMPPTVGNNGVEITLIRGLLSTGTVTINPTGADTVEALSGLSGASTSLAATGARGSKVTFICIATTWIRLKND